MSEVRRSDAPAEDLEKAAAEGKAARDAGLDHDACPYRLGSPLWHAWQEAHTPHAERRRRELP